MHVAFNQDASCCVTGTEHGFRVYNCSPFGKFYTSDDITGLGGVGVARMLFATSLVAVVGNGELNSPRRLAIVNTRRHAAHSVICELTFPTTVRHLLLNRQRLVVVLDAQIYIYNIANMKLLFTLDTVSNRGGVASITPRVATHKPADPDPAGSGAGTGSGAGHTEPDQDPNQEPGPDLGTAADVSTEPEASTEAATSSGASSATNISSTSNNWLVYPAGPPTKHHLAPPKTAGDVPKAPQGDVVLFDMDTLAPVTVIKAHRSPLALLQLNEDGTLLATTSDKGTLIRVFAIPSGTLLYELRRGSYQSQVYSISFSLGSKLLCVSSATQTVHIYRLDAAHRVRRKKEPETTDSLESPDPVDHADPVEPVTSAVTDVSIDVKKKKHWLRWKPSASSKSHPQKRDFAWFKVPVKHTVRTVVGMPPLANFVYVATESGKLFHFSLPESGGECPRAGEFQLD